MWTTNQLPQCRSARLCQQPPTERSRRARRAACRREAPPAAEMVAERLAAWTRPPCTTARTECARELMLTHALDSEPRGLGHIVSGSSVSGSCESISRQHAAACARAHALASADAELRS